MECRLERLGVVKVRLRSPEHNHIFYLSKYTTVEKIFIRHISTLGIDRFSLYIDGYPVKESEWGKTLKDFCITEQCDIAVMPIAANR